MVRDFAGASVKATRALLQLLEKTPAKRSSPVTVIMNASTQGDRAPSPVPFRNSYHEPGMRREFNIGLAHRAIVIDLDQGASCHPN